MVIAILWVTISFVGFVFAAIDVMDAYAHYILVKSGWSGRDRLTEFTKFQFMSQSARAILLLVFLVVGINVLANGPSGVFIYAMFIGNLVVVGTAIQSHRYRRKVFKIERRQYRTKQDVVRSEVRAKEDVEREGSRAKEDLSRNMTRAREDLEQDEDKEQQ